jgi:hypothetical protein
MISSTLTDYFDSFSLEESEKISLMNRIDTKYVVHEAKIPDILSEINEKYRILQINGNRIFSYHTTYLDTNEFRFFKMHVTRRPVRYKVRYRKYNDTGITFLEIKKRISSNRTIKWRIESQYNDLNFDRDALDFLKPHFDIVLGSMQTVLYNSFNRITLAGNDMNERVTIDLNLNFSRPRGDQITCPGLSVIEIKHNKLSDKSSFLMNVLKENKMKPRGFSKYCIGVASLYELPRKNILKPELLLIKAIEYEHFRNIAV